ncbi:FtsX-like permease family protein [Clostridium paraputrificum]|uniref:FtsX-like permease family protein n=1 Tax=Clostridium paraputrificum TaxID=29363 RepID=UPI00325B1021
MGVFKYIFLTIKNDLKENYFYMITMTMSIAIIFVSFNIIYNEEIVPQRSYEYTILSILGVVVLSVLILFMIFANSYYLEDKYKEYGVITLSGKSTFEIFIIISVRNLIMSLVAILFGCILGYVINPIIMRKVLQMINIENPTTYVCTQSLAITIIMTIVECLVVFLINSGQIYKKKIKELIIKKKSSFIPNVKRSKMKTYIYIIFYFIPLISLLLPVSRKDIAFVMLAAIVTSIFGIQGVVRYVIPNALADYKNKTFITDKIKLIIISNLYASIKRSTSLVLMYIITAVVTIVVIGQYQEYSVINTFALASFIFVVVILNFTIMYKFFIEAYRRKENFEQLRLMGYSYKEISKIILLEVTAYYLIVNILVLIQIILIFLASNLAGFISVMFVLKVLGQYIAITVFFGGISLVGYKKIACKKSSIRRAG